MVRNICLYVRKRRANVFNVVVIKLVLCRVMVLFGKELISVMVVSRKGGYNMNKACRLLEGRQALPIGPVSLPDADRSRQAGVGYHVTPISC
jgi:hypothetical protein